jgi:hypothetical protein
MDLQTFLKSKILQLTVFCLFNLSPKIGLSQIETNSKSSVIPKSFAVFVAHYNSHNKLAVGGVAGTAFFISPNKAITAFHVLQTASFNKHPDFEKVKIWLIHEGRSAIEVNLKNLNEQKKSDMTIIDFGNQKVVTADEIYSLQKQSNLQYDNQNLNVESDGFVANSTGPELFHDGSELLITRVGQLKRIHVQGQLLQFAEVDLKARDVNLVKAPCLQASYEPIVGLSGGPMTKDGKVVAMNSFADPSKKSTWALQLVGLNL